MNRMLEVNNVSKYYGDKENITKAVDGVSFSVNTGEFVGIMGSSGSGKTTLLNIISTIDTISDGSVIISGMDISQIKENKMAQFRRENLGYIFQDYNLLDTLTISENIALALAINKVDVKSIEQKVLDIASKLNIVDILSKYPYQVSGGQQQRATCARAIVTNPNLILADEPTGALDSKSSQILLETIIRINIDWKATVVMVTHDAFAASYCTRILFLKDGKIIVELKKEEKNQREFHSDILKIEGNLGGEKNEY